MILVPYRPADYAGRPSGIVAEAACLGRPMILTQGLDVIGAFLNRMAPGFSLTVPFDAPALARAMLTPTEAWRQLALAGRSSASIVLQLRDLRRSLTLSGLLPEGSEEPATP